MEVLAVSLYAFADELRMPESKVYAADLDRDGTPEERKKDFYCPSPNCTARMRLRSKSVYCACFFAMDGHSDSCMYGHLGTYDPNDYNEEKFDLGNAVMALKAVKKPSKVKSQTKAKGNTKMAHQGPEPPKTLNEILLMLKNHDCHDVIGGKKVGDMLLDDRSMEEFGEDFFGYRVVEAKLSPNCFYKKRPALKNLDRLQFIPFEKQVPYLSVLHLVLESDLQQFYFDVYFRDVEVFRGVIEKIWGGKGKTEPECRFAVVASHWRKTSKNEDRYATIVTTSKQISVFK